MAQVSSDPVSQARWRPSLHGCQTVGGRDCRAS